ncbi:Sec-independent protein translocase protein TatB [Stella sp.]|uniref:Sec-independent protein translocase protein TatB n=1 Tax=Stella sp. TaxID=2912054 RepID=UPI0035B20893
MFDIGWSELAVIAVVALVVIGPKDLPKVLRTVGQWVARARAVARDFQTSVDEMAREADLQDVKKHIDDLRNTNVSALIEKHVDPKGDLREAFEPPKELSHDPFAADPAPAPGDNAIRQPVDYVPPAEAPSVPADTPPAAVPDVPPPATGPEPPADVPAPRPPAATA